MGSDVLTGPTAPPTDETRLSRGHGFSPVTMKPKRPSGEATLQRRALTTSAVSL